MFYKKEALFTRDLHTFKLCLLNLKVINNDPLTLMGEFTGLQQKVLKV